MQIEDSFQEKEFAMVLYGNEYADCHTHIRASSTDEKKNYG